MKKINLISTLKKTFKTKKIIKKKAKKVVVKQKKIKPVVKLKKPKIDLKGKKTKTKSNKLTPAVKNKSKPTQVEKKTGAVSNVNLLRIPKNNEQKPEIKKVKKQDTEKKEYKIKDYVVYPKHGVGQITEFKKMNIGGIDIETYVLKFEKDKANGMVPVNKQSHLRPLATINQINKCISILKGKPKIKRSMWSRRAQEYEQKINSGEIYQIAEVVRDLNKNTDMPVDQSYSERQLFEKAYERLLGEVIAVLNIDEEAGKLKLNKALGKKPEVVQTSTPI